jgi:hypothetical protein
MSDDGVLAGTSSTHPALHFKSPRGIGYTALFSLVKDDFYCE